MKEKREKTNKQTKTEKNSGEAEAIVKGES